MKSMSKRLLASATTLMSVTALWAFTDGPPFNEYVPPPCPGTWEIVIESPLAEFQFSGPLQNAGVPIFSEAEVIREDDALAYVQRRFLSLQGEGHDERLGTVTWTIDAERQAAAEEAGDGLTTVRANQLDADLPATADIKFFLNATIEALPGRVFSSERQVRFVSDNITTYPFENEVIRLAEPVDFYDAETGEFVFTIVAGEGPVTSEG